MWRSLEVGLGEGWESTGDRPWEWVLESPPFCLTDDVPSGCHEVSSCVLTHIQSMLWGFILGSKALSPTTMNWDFWNHESNKFVFFVSSPGTVVLQPWKADTAGHLHLDAHLSSTFWGLAPFQNPASSIGIYTLSFVDSRMIKHW